MFEAVIRPFIAPNTLATQRIVARSTKQPVQKAGIIWGAAGTLPTPQESTDAPPSGVSFKVKKTPGTFVEKSRTTERVKIAQEGNPDNFVIVDRVKSIKFGQDKPPILKSLFAPEGVTGSTAAPGPTSFTPGPGETQIQGPGDHKEITQKNNVTETPIQVDPTEYTLHNVAGQNETPL